MRRLGKNAIAPMRPRRVEAVSPELAVRLAKYHPVGSDAGIIASAELALHKASEAVGALSSVESLLRKALRGMTGGVRANRTQVA
jgi:hypothetical protein